MSMRYCKNCSAYISASGNYCWNCKKWNPESKLTSEENNKVVSCKGTIIPNNIE